MTAALLTVRGLRARYGRVEVVHGIDLTVHEGERVALLGPNGAGKTTVLRALSRTIPVTGEVILDGVDLARRDAAGVARLGLGHVPQGRGTFAELSVAENLRLGLLGRRHRQARPVLGGPGRHRSDAADLEEVLTVFPILRQRRRQVAGSLSGGEQQMLALARALLAGPRLLLVDEPSQGLAPAATRDLFTALDAVQRRRGMAVVLAEQNVQLSLRMSDRAYLLRAGRVAAEGPAASMPVDVVEATYLGTEPSPGTRRSPSGTGGVTAAPFPPPRAAGQGEAG